MSSSYNNKKINEKIKITYKNKHQEESNEINFIKRTLENNTHEVLEDTKLKRITSWRKSETKFLKSLIINFFSLGIIHLFSLYYPNLYIKLYCNPCHARDCDFFLVEDIYGYFTLCLKIHKKNSNNNINNYNSKIVKDNSIFPFNINNNNRIQCLLSKNLTYSFVYKSITYEYKDDTNEIIPVYLNLSQLTNYAIVNNFGEGLSSEDVAQRYKERYGLNEYNINADLLYKYFKRIELPNFIIIIIIGFVELLLKDIISFIIKIFSVSLLLLLQKLTSKKLKRNLDTEDLTLDGEKNKLKVRRKYLLKEKNDLFIEIKNIDLLPGDIIFLKSNDIVPCDCLMIEGECIVNETNLTGSLNIFRKTSLDSNNEQFNYKYNNNNILFHGMRINKTISGLKDGYISVLCINTGSNTYKANQYSNILNLTERREEYKKIYNFFGEERKIICITTISIFFLSLLIGGGYAYIFKMTLLKVKELFPIIIIRLFCKSFMSVYYITSNIIIFLSILRLKSENIFCYDKSRLLSNAGKIDTIFFSKTGTLCKKNLEINEYHPVFINPHRPGIITYKVYKSNQCKEMNIKLMKYYKDYICKKNIKNESEFNLRHGLKISPNQLKMDKLYNQSNEYITLFLECLLSCNSLDKFNSEIYGNKIETTIFKDMNWDVKIFDYRENIGNNKKLDDYSKTTEKRGNKIFYNNKFVFIDKKVSDIFPKNYYKITETSNNEIYGKSFSLLRTNSEYFSDEFNINNNDNLPKKNNLKDILSSMNLNPIIDDISSAHIYSYKLRIYKKFIVYGTLNTSAIVYNFLTKELRFMIKGMAEDILDKCDRSSLPENFENTISYYRKKGFIILICATKLLNVEEYNDLNGYDYYLNELKFCGFITFQSILKKDIRTSINELKKFNCNLIITSGDNEYNCLSVGFQSGIIENKNVFVFDKDDKHNRVVIRKIYSVKCINEQFYEDTNTKKSSTLEKNSAKVITNKFVFTTIYRGKKKENTISALRSSGVKGLDLQNKDNKTSKTKIKISSRKSVYRKFKGNDNSKENSEREMIKNNFLNSELSEINKTDNKTKENSANSKPVILDVLNSNDTKNAKSRQKKENGNNQDYFRVRNKSIYFKKNDIKNNYIGDYERFYYYHGIFDEHADLKDNCIYCVSGKILNYLYLNKAKKECKYLLDHIYQYCKIFFCMSSIDKSISIDLYKDYPNSYICKIGECQSDFDPIMSSNVGINLREPKNINTLLCHFYTSDSNIICIKRIIMEGRNIDENISLLKVSSYFCTMIINSYIITCFIRNSEVIMGQLNFLEIILLLFSLLSFTGKPNNNINLNPLIRDTKLFNLHYYIQIIGIFIFKILAIYFASYFYMTNFDINIVIVDKIFCTYYFILCIELILSISFSFNFISLSRKHSFSKSMFITFVLLLVIYFIILISLNSSNFKTDFFKITFFEYQEYLIDSFDDRNRMHLILVCIVDFLISFFYSRIFYYIFYKVSEHKSMKKIEINN